MRLKRMVRRCARVVEGERCNERVARRGRRRYVCRRCGEVEKSQTKCTAESKE